MNVDQPSVQWRTSSFSGNNGTLAFTRAEIAAFVQATGPGSSTT